MDSIRRLIKTGNLFATLFSLIWLTFSSCNNDEITPLEIGDYYQGGVIFYLDETGQHGLISAVKSQTSIPFYSQDIQKVPWSCSSELMHIIHGTQIGSGAQNTSKQFKICPSGAVKNCINFEFNGYSDWYLPSKDELNELFKNRQKVDETAIKNRGSYLSDGEYWSSSTAAEYGVWIQDFTSGDQIFDSKEGERYFRPVRSF